MTPQVKHFLETWHKAVETRDAEMIKSIMAEHCELHSPVVWKPSADTRYILHILMGVISIVEDFAYRKEWVEGNELILEFTGIRRNSRGFATTRDPGWTRLLPPGLPVVTRQTPSN